MPFPSSFEIGRRRIGEGAPVFVIAEAGVNHNGDLGMAVSLVEAAAACGADAVKFQTFRASRLCHPSAETVAYQKRSTGEARQTEILAKCEMTPRMHEAVIEKASELGIIFLSTPFDEESADYLEALDIPAFKIPSGEITNHPFLEHIASKARPMILSTGMSDIEEVSAALEVISSAGGPPLAVLHCVSNYPARSEDANLRAMDAIRGIFPGPVGYSDHTLGLAVPISAVALGASIMEKHLTLSKNLSGPDHAASMEPDEFAGLVRAIREAEGSLGDGVKRPRPSEMEVREAVRKSLFTASTIRKGALIRREDLVALRPGTGIPPSRIGDLADRRAARDIPEGSLISEEDLE